MKLIVFDCDDTIWKLPYEEDDKYMELPDSIINHKFEYNEKIIKIYKKYKNDKNVKFALLTNRTYKLKNVILEKLKTEKKFSF